MRHSRRITLSALSGLTALALVSGCSSASGAKDAESEADGVTLHISEFAYTIPAVVNEMLIQVVKDNPDLGVKEIVPVQVDQAAAWAGAAKGDIDLMTEVALPNNQEALDANADTVTPAAKIYGPADSQGI